MGVTHGLPFESVRLLYINTSSRNVFVYIPWLDVYHFLSAQSLKCTFPTPVSPKFSKKSKLSHHKQPAQPYRNHGSLADTLGPRLRHFHALLHVGGTQHDANGNDCRPALPQRGPSSIDHLVFATYQSAVAGASPLRLSGDLLDNLRVWVARADCRQVPTSICSISQRAGCEGARERLGSGQPCRELDQGLVMGACVQKAAE